MTRMFGQTILAALASAFLTSTAWATEVSFWTWRQEDKAAYTEMFADFTKLHPDITVKFVSFPDENYPTLISTALAGGKGGDIIHAHAYGWLEQFVKSGYFLKLDQTSVPSLDNMPADALGSAMYRGDKQIYEVPFASQTLGLFINKDVFAKTGLTPPTTWDDFLKVSDQLKGKGIVPLANGLGTSWFNEMFVAAITNPFLGPDFVKDLTSGKATFKDPRYTAALGKMLELRPFLPQGYEGVDYDTSGQLFMSGQAAMLVGGSFDIATYRQQSPQLAMDFVAPPAAKSGQPSYVTKFYDGGYAVNAASPNKEAALQVVNYMGTKAFGDKLVSLLGDVSPIKGVEVKDPLLAAVARLNETAMPHINVVYFRFQKPTGSELLQGDITKMMAGTITPAQVGDDLTAGLAKWYAPFQSH